MKSTGNRFIGFPVDLFALIAAGCAGSGRRAFYFAALTAASRFTSPMTRLQSAAAPCWA